jgi:hypothetical protein
MTRFNYSKVVPGISSLMIELTSLFPASGKKIKRNIPVKAR